MAVASHYQPDDGVRAAALSHIPRPVLGSPIPNAEDRPSCLRGQEQVA